MEEGERRCVRAQAEAPGGLQWGVKMERQIQAGAEGDLAPGKSLDPILEAVRAWDGSPAGQEQVQLGVTCGRGAGCDGLVIFQVGDGGAWELAAATASLGKVADFFFLLLKWSFPAVGSLEHVLNTLGSEAESVPRCNSVSHIWSPEITGRPWTPAMQSPG